MSDINDLVDTAQEFLDRPCRGLQCNQNGPCQRHVNLYSFADRAVRLRRMWSKSFRRLCFEYLRAEAFTPAEMMLAEMVNAELQRRGDGGERILVSAMHEFCPGLVWSPSLDKKRDGHLQSESQSVSSYGE